MNASSPTTQQEILDLIRFVKPWSMRNNTKIRIGADADGGYVLPRCILECDVIVSIGIGDDVSFDLVLAGRGARVLQFDHTVNGPPISHPNFFFEKKGWGLKSEGEFISFDDIYARLQTLAPKRAMLKFDIEGAEYDVLDAMKPEHLAAFDIIACEFHRFERLLDRGFYTQARRVFEKMCTHHLPVHLHANNALGVMLADGVPIPLLWELTYLRRDRDCFPGPASDPIPGPYDRPNLRGRPDICMNPF